MNKQAMQIKNVGGSPAPVGGSNVPLLRLQTYGPSGGSTFTVIDDDLPALAAITDGAVIALRFPSFNAIPGKDNGGFVGLFPINRPSGSNQMTAKGSVVNSGSGLLAFQEVEVSITVEASGPWPAGFVQLTFGNERKALATDNTTSYTPSANYHPATKRYVDQQVSNVKAVMIDGWVDPATDIFYSYDDTFTIEEVVNKIKAGRLVYFCFDKTLNEPDPSKPSTSFALVEIVEGNGDPVVYTILSADNQTFGGPLPSNPS